MSASKLALLLGALAKLETAYNAAGGTVSAATDGLLLADLADLSEAFVHDGTRASPPGTAGFLPRTVPKGSSVETTLKVEPRGAGAAYSASVKPPEDVMMRICGHDVTATLGAGVEKYVYTPALPGSALSSLLLGAYSRGSLWMLQAGYGDWTWGADGPKIPLSEYALKLLFTSVADAAVPSITYPAPAVSPPVAENVLLSIGGVTTLVPKKFQFKQGRAVGPRNSQAAGGHAGFSPGRRAPMLTVTIEEPPTATYDARGNRRNAVQAAVSIQVGSVQYNRDKFAAPAAQLVDVKPSTDDVTACLDLTFQLNPTAAGASDEYSRTFD